MTITPTHINPAQWQQALGFSRQTCAKIFRDGGTPEDALRAFGLPTQDEDPESDWGRVVTLIADALCVNSQSDHRQAA